MSNNSTHENKCLYVVAEKGKWGIREHLKPLNPVYNGAGWFIEKKFQKEVAQLTQQANMRCIDYPLGGESFEELRRRNRREFLNEKAAKLKLSIESLKTLLSLKSLDNDEIIQKEFASKLEGSSEGERLLNHIKEFEHLQEQIKQVDAEKIIAEIKLTGLPILAISDRIKSHSIALSKYRGKKYLGLCVKTITEFNDKMLGLRKLILVAAAPNVGKTALTIQLAMEVLLNEPNACLVYVSLEMSAEEIFTRMNLYLSGLSFETYVLGCHKDEFETIAKASKSIEQIGDRLQIVDMSLGTSFSSEVISQYVEELKEKTGCDRAIVVIDYLQVWPVCAGVKLTSDLEADKWRIGEIKKIRDHLNVHHQDPIIVISEARKPSESDKSWAGDLADVMGSVRSTYTPDAVLLLNPLSQKQLNALWETKKMPQIKKGEGGALDIKAFLAEHGIAICNLAMPKGRDGMKKFDILLAFHFHKNKFDRINWLELRMLASDT